MKLILGILLIVALAGCASLSTKDDQGIAILDRLMNDNSLKK